MLVFFVVNLTLFGVERDNVNELADELNSVIVIIEVLHNHLYYDLEVD